MCIYVYINYETFCPLFRAQTPLVSVIFHRLEPQSLLSRVLITTLYFLLNVSFT